MTMPRKHLLLLSKQQQQLQMQQKTLKLQPQLLMPLQLKLLLVILEKQKLLNKLMNQQLVFKQLMTMLLNHLLPPSKQLMQLNLQQQLL